MHQVATNLIGAIGEVVREQEQARRADAVAGHDNDIRRLQILGAGQPVAIERAFRRSGRIALDPFDPRMGAQLDAGTERLRPDGQ